MDQFFNLVSLPILVITISLVVSLTVFYTVGKKAERSLALATMRIAELERHAIPISSAFQALLIQELTHFHTPEMDALMVKLGPPYTLTDREAGRLDELLVARSKGPNISQEERESAEMMRLIIKRVARDKGKEGLVAEPLIRILVTSQRAEK